MRFYLLLGSLLLISLVAQAQPVLTIDEFLSTVELAHPSIQAAQYEPDLAEAEIRGALGRFDPDLNMQYTYKFKDGTNKLNYLNGSVQLPLDVLFSPVVKAGYKRGLGSHINDENETTNSGEASLGVSIPLFQGIFTDRRRNALRQAMLKPDIAQAQYRMERNSLLRSAGLAYWNWSEAIAELSVADSMLSLASARLQQVVARIRAGEEAPIDSIEIGQEVLRRQGQLFEATRKAEQAKINASMFVWSQDGIPQEPRGAPSSLTTNSDYVAPVESASFAKLNRPEIARMKAMQHLARYDSSLAREFLRPFVQAEAALLSSDANAFSSLNYRIGLTVSQPLLFRSASAGAQAADIGVQRADLSTMIVQRVVEIDIQNAIVALDRARDRVQVAETETSLAQRMVTAEQQKLNAGQSTLLQVNLRERFYAEALLRLVKARGDFLRAIINIRWAMGTI